MSSNVNVIISDVLDQFGYTNIVGLTSGFNNESNAFSVHFDSATNTSFPTIDYAGPSQADYTEVVNFILNEIGYSNISGLSTSWSTSNNILDFSFSSATFPYSGVHVSITNYNATLDLDNYGNVTSFTSSAYTPTYGIWLSSDTLTTFEQAITKDAFIAIDALENLSTATTTNDVATIALTALGYSNVSGLSTSWNDSAQTSTLSCSSMYSATDGWLYNVNIVVTTNSSGSITSYSSTGTSNGYSYSFNQNALDATEVFVIEATNYALNKIDGITSNDNFTDVDIIMTFDESGNLSTYSKSMTHSDVGVIDTNISNVSTANRAILESAYTDFTNLEPEFQVNTTSFHDQRAADTTTLSDGSFVVVWESRYQDGDNWGIYAQHFDVSGNKLGAEIQVNTYTDSYQSRSEVTALNDGGYVVTWRSHGQDGDASGIYAQRYDVNDIKVGVEFSVNTETTSTQSYPSITVLVDGSFVITWNSKHLDGETEDIYAQRYNADGTPNGGNILVNTYTVDGQWDPSITALNDGGFVVVWHSYNQDSGVNDYGIYAQRYDANGAPDGSEFPVNTYTANDQYRPSIAALNDGGFVVVWHSYDQDAGVNDRGIYAQRYDANGAPDGNEFPVNTHTASNQSTPDVTSLTDGGFVIVWESKYQDGDSYGIYAQKFDASGVAVNGEFQVNTYTDSYQDNPSITALVGGGFVITWVSNGQDGSGYGIFAQRYDANSNQLGGASNVYDLINDAVASEDQLYSFDASTNFSAQNVGANFSYDATLADGSDLPAWLSISAAGVLTGTPTNEDAGLISITVVATDLLTSNKLYDTFYLTVNNVNDAPTLTGDFSGEIVVGDASITGSLVGDDVDEYFDIRDATNWTDYDTSTGNSDETIYTFTNTNGDIYVKTYYLESNGSTVSTYLRTLDNGDWHNQVKTIATDGDYTRHYTDSLETNFTVAYEYNTDGSRNVTATGDYYHHGMLSTNSSNLRTEDSMGVATSYSGTSYYNGQLITLSMDGVDENGDANSVGTMSTTLGIDWVHRDGLTYSINNQQGTYGSLKLNEQAEWIYTLDNTDPDIIALIGSGVDSFTITLSDGSVAIAQVIDINVSTATSNGSINQLIGTTTGDILNGTAGIDNITTLEGADVVYALAGNDSINLSADSVWSSGYAALNVGNNASVGTNQKINLVGLNRFSDVIDGGTDVDTLNLTTGNDAFFIDDVYSAHHSSLSLASTTQGLDSIARIFDLEIINAGEGNDIVDLTSDNFVLANAIEINGEAGDDILWGSNGNDVINGGVGNDTINGGAGFDALSGGTGADIFQFTATSGFDDILDFDITQDSIQLYYRAGGDNHTNADLDLTDGILTWDVDNTANDVVIDLSTTVTSSNFSDIDALITFVEIV